MNRPSPPLSVMSVGSIGSVGRPQARCRRRPALRRDRHDSKRGGDRYAASKWGAAPAACVLPPPPTHWQREGCCHPELDCALSLKLLLNVTV